MSDLPHVITATKPSFQRIAEATLVLVVLVGALVVWSVSRAGQAADNSTQVRIGNELQACRSQYNGQVTEALSVLVTIQTDGLRAVALGDKATLLKLADQQVTAKGQYQTAVRRYLDAIDDSIHHPDEFLARCKAQR